MRSGTWNVRSLYRAGSLITVARETAKCKLDLVGVQEVRWYRGGTEPAGDYIALIIQCLMCNITFHKSSHLYKSKSFLRFKIHYMFRPTRPSSSVKNMSNEEIAAITCC
jgi:hypothetical protein